MILRALENWVWRTKSFRKFREWNRSPKHAVEYNSKRLETDHWNWTWWPVCNCNHLPSLWFYRSKWSILDATWQETHDTESMTTMKCIGSTKQCQTHASSNVSSIPSIKWFVTKVASCQQEEVLNGAPNSRRLNPLSFSGQLVSWVFSI